MQPPAGAPFPGWGPPRDRAGSGSGPAARSPAAGAAQARGQLAHTGRAPRAGSRLTRPRLPGSPHTRAAAPWPLPFARSRRQAALAERRGEGLPLVGVRVHHACAVAAAPALLARSLSLSVSVSHGAAASSRGGD